MNRKLTHIVAAHTTHIGAPAAMRGSAAICAEPAYTMTDMKMASGMPMPLLAIATPATTPQAAIPTAIGTASRTPSRNIGLRTSAAALARQEWMEVAGDTMGRPEIRLHDYSGGALHLWPVMLTAPCGTSANWRT